MADFYQVTQEIAPGAGMKFAAEIDGDGVVTPLVKSSSSSGLSSAKQFVDKARHVHTTPITTGAWTELFAAVPDDVSLVEIFDSSGRLLKLGFGGAGSEEEGPFIFPGGNGPVSVQIPSGTRVSVRAVDQDTSGNSYLAVNLYK